VNLRARARARSMTGVRNDNRELGKRRRLVRKIRPSGRTCRGESRGQGSAGGKTRGRVAPSSRKSRAPRRSTFCPSFGQTRAISPDPGSLSSSRNISLESTFHLWPLRKLHFDKRTVLFRGTFSQRFRKRLAGRPKTLVGR